MDTMTSNHMSLKCHRFPLNKPLTADGPCQKVIVQKFAAVAVQQLLEAVLGRSWTKRRSDGNTLEHAGNTFGRRRITILQDCSESLI